MISPKRQRNQIEIVQFAFCATTRRNEHVQFFQTVQQWPERIEQLVSDVLFGSIELWKQ